MSPTYHFTILTAFHCRIDAQEDRPHAIAGVRWAAARPVEYSCDRVAAGPADTAAPSHGEVRLLSAPERHATGTKQPPWRAIWQHQDPLISMHQSICASVHEDDPNVGPGCGCPTPASTAHPGRQLQDGRERRLAGGSATHDPAPRPTGSISNSHRRPRSMSGRQRRRCRRSACNRRRGTISKCLCSRTFRYCHRPAFLIFGQSGNSGCNRYGFAFRYPAAARSSLMLSSMSDGTGP